VTNSDARTTKEEEEMTQAQQLREIKDLKARLARVENGRGSHAGPARTLAFRPRAAADGSEAAPANDANDVLIAAAQTAVHIALSPLKDGPTQALAFAPAALALLDNGLARQGLEAAVAPAVIGGAALLLARLIR
jgi:hypothetical protein